MKKVIHISGLTAGRAWLASFGGKKRNKRLLEKLAAFNRGLRPAEDYFAQLGLAAEHRELLAALAGLPEGWHPFQTSAGPEAPDARRPAALGLVRVSRRGEISLTDAGRFFLALTAPQGDSLPFE